MGKFPRKTCFTLWLFNSLPWKDPPFLIGKPSISMGHLYHGYVSHNQRVTHFFIGNGTTPHEPKGWYSRVEITSLSHLELLVTFSSFFQKRSDKFLGLEVNTGIFTIATLLRGRMSSSVKDCKSILLPFSLHRFHRYRQKHQVSRCHIFRSCSKFMVHIQEVIKLPSGYLTARHGNIHHF